MIYVVLDLGQLFLEPFVSTQAPCHSTPSHIWKPTFPQGNPGCFGSLEKSLHRNLPCL